MIGRLAYLGHSGHLAMVTVPIGLVIAGLDLGVLAHQIGNLFPLKWVPDTAPTFAFENLGWRFKYGRCSLL
ncbi:hypothetical protein DSO57_1036127 [Entomophthora muscae]|uniref:Uncharacterized protein n=1 Tax=Entomophthora muscae TaxID=34485 RepID=A0ACC2TLT2_9FUNG|nr:hypothetical protein DSO57_1036127 [Entomophthora muscae]